MFLFFFFFIEKKMDIIVPLQYVNGLNPVPSFLFFFFFFRTRNRAIYVLRIPEFYQRCFIDCKLKACDGFTASCC